MKHVPHGATTTICSMAPGGVLDALMVKVYLATGKERIEVVWWIADKDTR